MTALPIVLIAKLLLIASALLLVGALLPTRQLMSRLPPNSTRGRWYLMLAFVVFFLLGYLVYAWAFWDAHARPIDLLVPVIFLFGAGFVWLNAALSLQTVIALMRLNLLEQENIADPLTGVYNRRHLERRLKEEVASARRHGLPLSVLMLDIDHFKQINDRHGHQAGDQVLVLFAGLIKGQLREPDVVVRYGGEEFLVIAPQTAHADAICLAQRLRTHIESNAFTLPEARASGSALEIRLTCSIGVASLGEDLTQPEAIVQRADENLYRAKQAGRNRVGVDPSAGAQPG